MKMLTESQIEKRLEMHRNGLSDLEMAIVLNKSKNTIHSWRGKRKLRANRRIKPIKIKKIEENDKIYLAGFFDGEGCATIIYNKKNDYMHPIIQIGNTNIDIILWIKKIIGDSCECRVYNHKLVENRNWKQVYRIYFRGYEDVKCFAEQMIDYCKVKKQQLILLKEFCELHLNSPAHSHYSEREYEILKKIRLLNKRGRF